MTKQSRTSLGVCVFGYDEKDEGGRIWAIRTGLAENGIAVKRCQSFVDGFFAKYRDLLRKWKSITGDIDALYVVFMGSYLMPLAWYLARRRGVPILLVFSGRQSKTRAVNRRRG